MPNCSDQSSNLIHHKYVPHCLFCNNEHFADSILGCCLIDDSKYGFIKSHLPSLHTYWFYFTSIQTSILMIELPYHRTAPSREDWRPIDTILNLIKLYIHTGFILPPCRPASSCVAILQAAATAPSSPSPWLLNSSLKNLPHS